MLKSGVQTENKEVANRKAYRYSDVKRTLFLAGK